MLTLVDAIDGDGVILDPRQVGFVLDKTWARIVFGEAGQSWVKSYGDWPGQHEFTNPSGLKALKFPDGSCRIFVADKGNAEIDELNYNLTTQSIEYVRSFTTGLQTPVDVDVSPQEAWTYPSSYKIWVADQGLGAVIALDPNGNVVRTISSYTYESQTYDLNLPERVLANHLEDVSFIDRGENAFVVVGPGNTVVSVIKFDSPSQLTNIGLGYGTGLGSSSVGEYIISDIGLQRIHKVTIYGAYVADYSLGIFRIELATKQVLLLPPLRGATLLGIDGLNKMEGSLIAIQNGINPHRVIRLRLNQRGDMVESWKTLEANHTAFDEPTLGVADGAIFYYIASSQWSKVDRNGNLAPEPSLANHVVLKMKLSMQ